MRIGTSRVFGALRQVVRQRSSPYTITRPDQDSSGRFGETTATTTDITDVDIWLYDPEEVNVDTQYGDRLGGDLQGLSLPSADVAVHDIISHGSDEYEVARIMHLPDNGTQQLKQFSLERRTNDSDTPA